MPATARASLIEVVARWAGRPQLTSDRPMTSEELTCFAAIPGVEIASHSQHHVWLPVQPPDVRRDEMEGSRSRLEAILGRSVAGFSYPYGAYDASCPAAVRAAGYGYAVTTEHRCVTAQDDRYALPRLAVEDLDRPQFNAFLDRIFGERE